MQFWKSNDILLRATVIQRKTNRVNQKNLGTESKEDPEEAEKE